MIKPYQSLLVLLAIISWAAKGLAFEGRIQAVIIKGTETSACLYTVGTHFLRIERMETNWPHVWNVANLDTGTLTLLFPNNRSFVRLKPAIESGASPFPAAPAMPPPMMPGSTAPNIPGLPARPDLPALPPGIGPQADATPGGISGATPMAGMPAMGAMPMMPMPGVEKLELRPTGDKTNLLGYVCLRFELKQRGEVMEIWATDQLLPFQLLRQNQSPRLGPQMIEEQWGGLLKAKKLFPLLAILKFENGPERYRFEVKKIQSEKMTDDDAKQFQPPAGYLEIQPMPF
jgi:hypothetical protein